MKNFSESDIKKDVKSITVYTLPNGYIIEADKGEEITDFYIYHKDYGVKMLMFVHVVITKSKHEHLYTIVLMIDIKISDFFTFWVSFWP